jgi:hypothetical protein
MAARLEGIACCSATVAGSANNTGISPNARENLNFFSCISCGGSCGSGIGAGCASKHLTNRYRWLRLASCFSEGPNGLLYWVLGGHVLKQKKNTFASTPEEFVVLHWAIAIYSFGHSQNGRFNLPQLIVLYPNKPKR